MPNAPISGLPAAGALAPADLAVVVKGGITSQTTVGGFTAAAGLALSRFRHVAYIAGRIYSLFPFALAVTGSACVANEVYAGPFVVPSTLTIDELTFRLNGLFAGGNLQLAIYLANSAGQPTGLPLATTVSVSTAAAGTKVVALSAAVTLDPDLLYCLCSNCDNGVAIYNAMNTGQSIHRYWHGATAGNFIFAANSFDNYWNTAQAFGAWPDLTAAVWASQGAAKLPYTGGRAV